MTTTLDKPPASSDAPTASTTYEAKPACVFCGVQNEEVRAGRLVLVRWRADVGAFSCQPCAEMRARRRPEAP